MGIFDSIMDILSPKDEGHHSDGSGKGPADIQIIRHGHEMIHQDVADAVRGLGEPTTGFCGDPTTRKLGNAFYQESEKSNLYDVCGKVFSNLSDIYETAFNKCEEVLNKMKEFEQWLNDSNTKIEEDKQWLNDYNKKKKKQSDFLHQDHNSLLNPEPEKPVTLYESGIDTYKMLNLGAEKLVALYGSGIDTYKMLNLGAEKPVTLYRSGTDFYKMMEEKEKEKEDELFSQGMINTFKRMKEREQKEKYNLIIEDDKRREKELASYAKIMGKQDNFLIPELEENNYLDDITILPWKHHSPTLPERKPISFIDIENINSEFGTNNLINIDQPWSGSNIRHTPTLEPVDITRDPTHNSYLAGKKIVDNIIEQNRQDSLAFERNNLGMMDYKNHYMERTMLRPTGPGTVDNSSFLIPRECG